MKLSEFAASVIADLLRSFDPINKAVRWSKQGAHHRTQDWKTSQDEEALRELWHEAAAREKARQGLARAAIRSLWENVEYEANEGELGA